MGRHQISLYEIIDVFGEEQCTKGSDAENNTRKVIYNFAIKKIFYELFGKFR